MSTKIIEGVEYILKSSVEQIIKDRVNKVATRASQYETQVSELQSKINGMKDAVSNVDILTSKIEELQAQLSQSNDKYQRFQTISKHGVSNQKMIDAIEWTYKYEQERLPKKDQQSLSDWLDHQVANPDQAHDLLRPHFQALQANKQPMSPETSAPSQTPPSQTPPSLQTTRDPIPPPSANRGAIPHQDESNFWDRAANDPKFYEANREEIRQRINNNRRQ